MAENMLGDLLQVVSQDIKQALVLIWYLTLLVVIRTFLDIQTQMGDQQRDQMVKNLLAVEPITDRAKARDFERNMAAARFRTQLGTQQGLTLQGQMGAQKLAQQGMQGATTSISF